MSIGGSTVDVRGPSKVRFDWDIFREDVYSRYGNGPIPELARQWGLQPGVVRSFLYDNRTLSIDSLLTLCYNIPQLDPWDYVISEGAQNDE